MKAFCIFFFVVKMNGIYGFSIYPGLKNLTRLKNEDTILNC